MAALYMSLVCLIGEMSATSTTRKRSFLASGGRKSRVDFSPLLPTCNSPKHVIRVCGRSFALGHERRDPLERVPERVQPWVEAVLDGQQSHARRELRQHRGVVVTLGAEQNWGGGGGLPVGEVNELGRQRRAVVHADAVAAPGFDLRRVHVHEGDRYAGCAEGVAHRTADPAGADHGDRVHACPRLCPT